jgi:hypothetical protein
MDREVSIVLSVERRNYRKVAQEWYGLTDEQMEGMDVHHNPPVSQGGRNIPEHLFVYHPTLHTAVHEFEFIMWSRVGGREAHREKAEDGKSLHGIRSAKRLNSDKDELGRSKAAVKGAQKANEKKDDKGRSLNALKGGYKSTSKKDHLGRSVSSVKGAEKANAQKDDKGRSVNAVKGAAKAHSVKDSSGRSAIVVKMNEKTHKVKDELGRSVHAVETARRTNSQKWMDPDHPELGIKTPGPLVTMQKARGYPHGPENRVRVA